MNIEQIIKANTNEEGVVDYEAVNKTVAEDTQSQLNAVSAKTKAKYTKKIEEMSKPPEVEVPEEPKHEISEVEKKLNAFLEQQQKKEEKETFLKNARENNVPEEIVNTLINSNAELTNVDISALSKVTLSTTVTPDNSSQELITAVIGEGEGKTTAPMSPEKKESKFSEMITNFKKK